MVPLHCNTYCQATADDFWRQTTPGGALECLVSLFPVCCCSATEFRQRGTFPAVEEEDERGLGKSDQPRPPACPTVGLFVRCWVLWVCSSD